MESAEDMDAAAEVAGVGGGFLRHKFAIIIAIFKYIQVHSYYLIQKPCHKRQFIKQTS